MAVETRRSFFATTAGIVTGLAGLITAVVGLLTVGVQLGWFGSDDAAKTDTTGGGQPAASTTAPANLAANFTVDPAEVTFQVVGPRESLVTVRNIGPVAISWRPPSVTGADRSAFTGTDVSCGARLDPNRTCQVRVRFAPGRSGDFTATLVLQPENGLAQEVKLVGKALL
jgi:hypothetical protein